LGNRAIWSPLLRRVEAPVNSDFFPFVDQNSARFRFLSTGAAHLLRLGTGGVPILEALGIKSAPAVGKPVGSNSSSYFESLESSTRARELRDHILGLESQPLVIEVWQELATLRASGACSSIEKAQIYSLNRIAHRMIVYLNPQELAQIWSRISAESPCLRTNETMAPWLSFYRALGARNFAEARSISESLLERQGPTLSGSAFQTLIVASMCGYLLGNDATGFRGIHDKYYLPAVKERRLETTLVLDVLISQALDRGWRL
jgi:hypothetical protein